MPAKKPMAEWKHGTHGTYVNGCRCDLCRRASNAYKRRLYHRNLTASRAYCREKARRYAHQRSVGDLDAAIIKRDLEYKAAQQAASGDLAALIAEQLADDVFWINPVRGFARPFDETRWNGRGERGPERIIDV